MAVADISQLFLRLRFFQTREVSPPKEEDNASIAFMNRCFGINLI